MVWKLSENFEGDYKLQCTIDIYQKKKNGKSCEQKPRTKNGKTGFLNEFPEM